MAALGIARAGVGQGVGEHVQHVPGAGQVSGLAGQRGPVADQGLPLPCHADGQRAVAAVGAGVAHGAVEVPGVVCQPRGRRVPGGAPASRRDRLQDGGRVHERRQVHEHVRACRRGPGAGCGREAVMGGPGVPRHVQSHGGGHTAGDGPQGRQRPRSRGAQPVRQTPGSLQRQQHRVVHGVLGHGLGQHAEVGPPRDGGRGTHGSGLRGRAPLPTGVHHALAPRSRAQVGERVVVHEQEHDVRPLDRLVGGDHPHVRLVG